MSRMKHMDDVPTILTPADAQKRQAAGKGLPAHGEMGKVVWGIDPSGKEGPLEHAFGWMLFPGRLLSREHSDVSPDSDDVLMILHESNYRPRDPTTQAALTILERHHLVVLAYPERLAVKDMTGMENPRLQMIKQILHNNGIDVDSRRHQKKLDRMLDIIVGKIKSPPPILPNTHAATPLQVEVEAEDGDFTRNMPTC